MPNFSDGERYCVLCGQRVDEFGAEHRGEKPPAGGVGPCPFVAAKVAEAIAGMTIEAVESRASSSDENLASPLGPGPGVVPHPFATPTDDAGVPTGEPPRGFDPAVDVVIAERLASANAARGGKEQT